MVVWIEVSLSLLLPCPSEIFTPLQLRSITVTSIHVCVKSLEYAVKAEHKLPHYSTTSQVMLLAFAIRQTRSRFSMCARWFPFKMPSRQRTDLVICQRLWSVATKDRLCLQGALSYQITRTKAKQILMEKFLLSLTLLVKLVQLGCHLCNYISSLQNCVHFDISVTWVTIAIPLMGSSAITRGVLRASNIRRNRRQ